MRFLLYGIGGLVVFTVFVAVFAASADAREVRLLPKWFWVALCVVITPFGGILYLIFGRPKGPGKEPQTRTIAPDDDPDFLADLARKLREEDDNGDKGPNV